MIIYIINVPIVFFLLLYIATYTPVYCNDFANIPILSII